MVNNSNILIIVFLVIMVIWVIRVFKVIKVIMVIWVFLVIVVPSVANRSSFVSVAPEQALTHDLPKSRVLEGLPQGNVVILAINPWAFLLTNFQDSYFSDSQEKAS